MKAIIYTRVSTTEQADEGGSLASQERICRSFANRSGYEVAKVFEERGVSAKTAERPRLQEMKEYCAEHCGDVDALLIYKVDRLARNARDYTALREYFNGLDIEIISVTEPFKNDPAGRFMENMLAIAAQFENEQRAERCKGGMVEAVKEGRWVWLAPFGYRNTRVNGKKNIAPENNLLRVELLREAWSLIDCGHTVSDALRIVTAKGLVGVSGSPLSFAVFSKMFRKKVYMGVIETDLVPYDVKSDSIVPIVDEDLWWRVYDRLEGRKVNPSKYCMINPLYPLRGLLRCPEGHRMTGSAPTGSSGKRYPKYHCPRCKGKHASYDVAKVDAEFKDYADALSFDTSFSDALAEAVRLNYEEETVLTDKRRKSLERELGELEDYDMEVVRKNLRGKIPDDSMQRMLEANDRRRAEINEELRELAQDAPISDTVIEYGLNALSHLGGTWVTIENIAVRQRFQEWIFPEGVTYDGKTFGTPRLPRCLQINRGDNPPDVPVVELMRKTANSTSTATRAAIQLDTCIVRVSKNWFVVVGTCQK